MSAREAAEKWGVSLRQVQRLAAQGRVEGLVRVGRACLLPSDAARPADLRRRSVCDFSAASVSGSGSGSGSGSPAGYDSVSGWGSGSISGSGASVRQLGSADVSDSGSGLGLGLSSGSISGSGTSVPALGSAAVSDSDSGAADSLSFLPYNLASMALYVPAERGRLCLDALGDADVRRQYEFEFAYLRGDFAAARGCFAAFPDGARNKLCAATLSVLAAISLGDYSFYLRLNDFLQERARVSSEPCRMLAELSLSAAYTGMWAPQMAPEWLRRCRFDFLPFSARPFALYLYVKFLQSRGEFALMLASARTLLAMRGTESGFSSLDVYLYILCALGHLRTGEHEAAEEALLTAMSRALPFGVIAPFTENLYPLGKFMETCLERYFPESLAPVVRLSRDTWKNWAFFHNLFTRDNVTVILSKREYLIAQLAAEGVPYSEIARLNFISVGRLKNVLHDIYGKLSVSSRKELAPFVLWNYQKQVH